MDTKTNRSQTDWYRWRVGGIGLLLAIVLFVGLCLAIGNDAQGDSQAAREIGGAMVAGVVVGVAVLLLELVRDARQDHSDRERHEALLEQNQEHHEDELRAAWRREVLKEIALLAFVTSEAEREQIRDSASIGEAVEILTRLAHTAEAIEGLARLIDAGTVQDLASSMVTTAYGLRNAPTRLDREFTVEEIGGPLGKLQLAIYWASTEKRSPRQRRLLV